MSEVAADRALGLDALGGIDALLAARPHQDGLRAAETVRQLSAWRDRFTSHACTPEGRDRLERLNAVLSVVLAFHFPHGATPWGELEKARGWLAALLEPPIA